jgi:NADH-quinone oxidoreductase subunit A
LLANYGYIGLFIVVAILFAVVMILIPAFLSIIGIVPKKPNPVKNSPYECGMETIGRTWVQFNFRYYFYALIFLALDVLVVFVYPWAAGVRQLGGFAFSAILIFVFIVSIGYMYAWKKRVLEWK